MSCTRILAVLAAAAIAASPLGAAPQGVAPPSAAPKPENAPAPSPDPANASPPLELIDINSASLDELMTLPGVVEAYARKIVAGRPYKSKLELATRRIIPRTTYSKIRGFVTVNPSPSPSPSPAAPSAP